MVFVIAEIGINHNGDIKIAKKLIDIAVLAGCDAVKFQKRTIEKVYSKDVLDSPRESPWGVTTREQKLGLEFSFKDYELFDILLITSAAQSLVFYPSMFLVAKLICDHWTHSTAFVLYHY